MSQAKATLFDISDLAHPRALATVAYPPGSVAQAGMQPHQVTWLPDSGTLLTVVSDGYGGRVWVSVLTVGDGSLHDRLVPVDVGRDVAGVRTVPLAGRPGGAGRRRRGAVPEPVSTWVSGVGSTPCAATSDR